MKLVRIKNVSAYTFHIYGRNLPPGGERLVQLNDKELEVLQHTPGLEVVIMVQTNAPTTQPKPSVGTPTEETPTETPESNAEEPTVENQPEKEVATSDDAFWATNAEVLKAVLNAISDNGILSAKERSAIQKETGVDIKALLAEVAKKVDGITTKAGGHTHFSETAIETIKKHINA